MPHIFEILFVSFMILLVVLGVGMGFYVDKEKEERYREWCEANGGFYVESRSFNPDKCEFTPEMRAE